MDIDEVAAYVIVFVFGLVIGRVWGGASARGAGNMLTSNLSYTTPATLTPGRPVPGTPASALEDEIKRIAASGNLLQAIKVYRERTGCGLREARDAVARICGI